MSSAMLFINCLLALDTQAVQAGINRSAIEKVPFVLPAGVHTTGTLRLPSFAHLRFAPGAILRMTRQDADYAPPERLGFEPYADRETSIFEHALLFSTDTDNVTIDGPGLIQCDRLQRGGPKPIALRRCRNVKLLGFTIDQAPNYAVSLIDCLKVDIGGLTITRAHSDGIDLDGTRDARIHDCDIESYDDAICLKSSASLKRRLMTSNIVVENCRLKSSSAFFKIGTETFGDFQKIRVRKLIMTGGTGNRHGNPGIAIMTVDGGTIRDVIVEDISMTQVGTPIFLRIGDRKRAPGVPSAGDIEGVHLRRITARGTRYPSVIAGLVDAPIRRLVMEQLDLEAAVSDRAHDPRQSVLETRSAYPEPTQFGPIPASVLFMRHALAPRIGVFKYPSLPQPPAVLLDQVTGNWQGCEEVIAERWACLGDRPPQQHGSGVRPREKRFP